MYNEQYWNERAADYRNLKWVKQPQALDTLVGAIGLEKDDAVLDIGTGTGALAIGIAPLVHKVIGVDISRAMLYRAEKADNIFYVEWDACSDLFAPSIFDKVTARQMLHHIPKEAVQGVVGRCESVLKAGGCMAVVEPVCPTDEIRDEYAEIFALKDGRNVLTEADIIGLMYRAGLVNLRVERFVTEGFSVRNWLENNALEVGVQDRLFEMHVTASEAVKRAYGMQITNGDCLINIQNVVVLGDKADNSMEKG